MYKQLLGLLIQEFSNFELRSLAPVGGSTLWDGLLSYCPLLSFLRYSFNPLLVGAGSAAADSTELQYVHSPRYVACVVAEIINYEHLRPWGLYFEPLEYICTRK